MEAVAEKGVRYGVHLVLDGEDAVHAGRLGDFHNGLDIFLGVELGGHKGDLNMFGNLPEKAQRIGDEKGRNCAAQNNHNTAGVKEVFQISRSNFKFLISLGECDDNRQNNKHHAQNKSQRCRQVKGRTGPAGLFTFRHLLNHLYQSDHK